MINNKPELRSFEEIQAAHDRLLAILLGDVPNPFVEPEVLALLNSCASVLCWILRHDHNQSFEDNLRKIDDFLRARGLVLTDSGKLITPEKPQ